MSVPIDVTKTRVLYIFVDIAFDVDHFIRSVKKNFPNQDLKIALAGTIQLGKHKTIKANVTTKINCSLVFLFLCINLRQHYKEQKLN